MGNTNVAFRVLLADQPMGYHPALANVCGGLAEGILLSRLLYWDGVMDRKHGEKYSGKFYKSDRELREETGLSESELKTAKKNLSAAKLIALSKHGVPPTTHYEVKIDALQAAIESGVSVNPSKRARGARGKFAKATIVANQLATNGELNDLNTVNQLTENRSYIQNGIQDATQYVGDSKTESPANSKRQPAITQEQIAYAASLTSKVVKDEKPPESAQTVAAKERIRAAVEHFERTGGQAGISSPHEELREMVGALAAVTQQATECNGGKLAKTAKQLLKVDGVTPAKIREWYASPGCWWTMNDWRGQRGQIPDIAAINSTVKMARDGVKPNGNGHNGNGHGAAQESRFDQIQRVILGVTNDGNGNEHSQGHVETIDGVPVQTIFG